MEVDLKGKTFVIQPTLTTPVYAAKDSIGGLIGVECLPNDTGDLLSLVMVDKLAKAPAIDINFYSQSVGGTITDNLTLAVTAADHAAYFLGRVSIAAADWSSTSTQAVNTNLVDVTKKAADCGIKLESTGKDHKVYIAMECVVAPSGAYTAGAGDLTLRLGINQD